MLQLASFKDLLIHLIKARLQAVSYDSKMVVASKPLPLSLGVVLTKPFAISIPGALTAFPAPLAPLAQRDLGKAP